MLTAVDKEKPRIQLIFRLKNMKRRCYDPSFVGYSRYGGRGIKVCEEWLSCKNSFIEWSLSNGFSKEKQIDRINNDGDYSPENCRWVTRKENLSNTSRNVIYNGETATNASARLGGSRYLVSKRIAYGWDIDDAFNTPTMTHKGKSHRGKTT